MSGWVGSRLHMIRGELAVRKLWCTRWFDSYLLRLSPRAETPMHQDRLHLNGWEHHRIHLSFSFNLVVDMVESDNKVRSNFGWFHFRPDVQAHKARNNSKTRNVYALSIGWKCRARSGPEWTGRGACHAVSAGLIHYLAPDLVYLRPNVFPQYVSRTALLASVLDIVRQSDKDFLGESWLLLNPPHQLCDSEVLVTENRVLYHVRYLGQVRKDAIGPFASESDYPFMALVSAQTSEELELP